MICRPRIAAERSLCGFCANHSRAVTPKLAALTRRLDRRRMCLSILIAVIFFRPVSGSTHPHVWIDLRVEIDFDKAERIAGLRETWLLDEDYTAYVTKGFTGPDGRIGDDKLAALLQENMKHLADFSYFTKVTADKVPVGFGKAVEMSSHLSGKQLEMTFLLPFADPVIARGHQVVYAVYDPTYYIEVLHQNKDKSIRLVGAPPDCHARLM